MLNFNYDRVRTTQHAARDRCHILECLYGLADVVERSGGAFAECLCVIHPHCKRMSITLSKNALRHEYRFAQQCLGFFKAL